MYIQNQLFSLEGEVELDILIITSYHIFISNNVNFAYT